MKWINNNKNMILEMIIIFVVTLIINLIYINITQDEVWNFGFAYNIANGLIPYKDFNMVVTPLFPMLGALFLYVFGKNFFIYHIFNAIICTIIFYLMKKLTSKGYYIVYAILIFLFSLPNYSLFCLLLLYLIMYLEDKNTNDYIIGVLLGLTFLTKQNVGVFLCFPTLFTKDIKKIIKRIIGFFIPNIIFIIYLFCTDSFMLFIDYAFGGIGSFAKENNLISEWVTLTLVAIIYLIYNYIKQKDIKILYILCFQILAYPIFDTYHVIIPFLPVLGYFLSKLNLMLKVTRCAFIIFIIILFSQSLYNLYLGNYKFSNDTNVFKYRILDNNSVYYIKGISNYIKISDGNVFIIHHNAYLYKLESGMPINKYDLLNDGNMGNNGEFKIISEFEKKCNKEKCTFLILEEEIGDYAFSQTNQEIIKYICDNYIKTEEIYGLTAYTNKS